MTYDSVDKLQLALTKSVFHYAKDSKKAAGRALGTLVEVITFYALKSWGFEKDIAIERPLPEFANGEITHNVEYSIHPSSHIMSSSFEFSNLPLTTNKMSKSLEQNGIAFGAKPKSQQLLSKQLVLRNSCTIFDNGDSFINAYLGNYDGIKGEYSVECLHRQPYSIVECKRVGVEEGMCKGPQTIEKAKQGAYVARTVSSLQKIRLKDGGVGGIIQKYDGTFIQGDYYKLMAQIIASDDRELLRKFILTIGIVSNHGNWFTSENQNKELKVLAQSYDWLLFLTDLGLAQFVEDFLLSPSVHLKAAQNAFLSSYPKVKNENKFTKVNMALNADAELQDYFTTNASKIDSWFNVIAPREKSLATLKDELKILKSKNWSEIHK